MENAVDEPLLADGADRFKQETRNGDKGRITYSCISIFSSLSYLTF